MQGGLDPNFATWYAAHVMKAYEAQRTDEMRYVQRERMEREEARRTCFRRWFVVNPYELFFALLRFAVLSVGVFLHTLFLVGSVAVGVGWMFILVHPFARAACYHHALPDTDVCLVDTWQIPDTNITVGSAVLYEIHIGFKALNEFIESFMDLDKLCVGVYDHYGMNFTKGI